MGAYKCCDQEFSTFGKFGAHRRTAEHKQRAALDPGQGQAVMSEQVPSSPRMRRGRPRRSESAALPEREPSAAGIACPMCDSEIFVPYAQLESHLSGHAGERRKKNLELDVLESIAKTQDRLERLWAREMNKELSETEEQQDQLARQNTPGAYLDVGKPTVRKVPWTKAAVEAAYPMVDIYPARNVPVQFSKAKYFLIAGIKNTVPSIIADIYQESELKARQNDEWVRRAFHANQNDPFGIQGISIPGGGLPSDFEVPGRESAAS